MKKTTKLSIYEKNLEKNLSKNKKIRDEKKVKDSLLNAAKNYLSAKKPVTIRLSVDDIESMKIKASRMGIPYQTYINILIHKDATIR